MASDGHNTDGLSLPPVTWTQSGQVSLTLAQRPGSGRELSSEEEMEGTSLTGESWETSTRRNRHGNKWKVGT